MSSVNLMLTMTTVKCMDRISAQVWQRLGLHKTSKFTYCSGELLNQVGDYILITTLASRVTMLTMTTMKCMDKISAQVWQRLGLHKTSKFTYCSGELLNQVGDYILITTLASRLTMRTMQARQCRFCTGN